MSFDTFDTSTGSDVLVSTTFYVYNDYGNVRRIITEAVDDGGACGSDTEYTATRFEYARNGTTVTHVLGETWCADALACGTNYDVTYVREFMYDGARQRYRVRTLDTNNLAVLDETWTDYDRNSPYGDYTVSGSVATDQRSYEPGIAKVDPFSTGTPEYYHTDHLGTTRFLTDSNGAMIDSSVYTAFGEHIAGTHQRFGYAGAWGYQATIDNATGTEVFPYLHVGARYYDPSSGRFLQRDPIGIGGSTNVYSYVGNTPAIRVDPNGLDKFEIWQRQRDEAILNGTYDANRARGEDAARAAGAILGCTIWAAILYNPVADAILDWLFPGPPPPVRPSIPDNLPEGPLPPMNPDDYPEFYPGGSAG